MLRKQHRSREAEKTGVLRSEVVVPCLEFQRRHRGWSWRSSGCSPPSLHYHHHHYYHCYHCYCYSLYTTLFSSLSALRSPLFLIYQAQCTCSILDTHGGFLFTTRPTTSKTPRQAIAMKPTFVHDLLECSRYKDSDGISPSISPSGDFLTASLSKMPLRLLCLHGWGTSIKVSPFMRATMFSL